MSADKMRDEFSAWLGMDQMDPDIDNHGDEWQAWQAATATQAAEIARLTQELAEARAVRPNQCDLTVYAPTHYSNGTAAPVQAQGVLTDEQIDALWAESRHFPTDDYRWRHFARAILAAQAPANDALDAARYRYIRDTGTLESAVWEALEGYSDTGGEIDQAEYAAGMDAAIDAALKEQK